MGAVVCTIPELAGQFSDMVGYKSGLALDRQQLHAHAHDCPNYEDDFFLDESDGWIRMRSEEIQAIAAWLLWRVGYLESPNIGPVTIRLHHKYKNQPRFLALFHNVCQMFIPEWRSAIERTKAAGTRLIDPEPVYRKVVERFGEVGGLMALELFAGIDHEMRADPFSQIRDIDWKDPVALKELFESEALGGEMCTFIDQRFIDYLASNPDAMATMNWRKFEGLTAEYFEREGYQVQIGPGRADGGIDVRVWKADDYLKKGPPLILIQCKRQKANIEQVIVKALWADVVAEGAQSGLIVTTSKLAPGAKAVIRGRSYPVETADRNALRRWLKEMRRPGSGIFMGE